MVKGMMWDAATGKYTYAAPVVVGVDEKVAEAAEKKKAEYEKGQLQARLAAIQSQQAKKKPVKAVGGVFDPINPMGPKARARLEAQWAEQARKKQLQASQGRYGGERKASPPQGKGKRG